ncbi:hypothetical protein LZ012_05535 [Dechloromonas sp. XY25]|uniref:Formylmethanofuran dehydrogenase subunit E domain-containing protein n=1 Tax=Dechloromonas hankyongensis TaxID=2908002 RepID=A0ABS9JZV7_9RHOO|nr:hypothetical protein [Dechloromonas hankyongensis]MCG2576454.1 hypothetical protein [Dechloromonas hankyongensis]
MQLPEFFSQAPAITLYDPLAELLGAAQGGLIDYHFADAVKLAGHSCPTVAGAWLATVHGLRALYGDATPVRGEIAVALAETVDDGVAGVIASIATLLTGAAGAGGFKGLGGRYGRRNLLAFGVAGVAGIRLTRRDTGASVDSIVRLQSVAGDPRMGELLPQILHGIAGQESIKLFGQLWQDRVRRILTGYGDGRELVEIRHHRPSDAQTD